MNPIDEANLPGRPNQVTRRHRNRILKHQHVIESEAYLDGLQDIISQPPEVNTSNDSISDDSEEYYASDLDIESTTSSESEYDGDINDAQDTRSFLVDPTKKSYSIAVLSALLGLANLNLSTAEIVVSLINNYNRRFAGPNAPLLPNVKHYWRSLTTQSDFHVHILCDKGHSHGPYFGEPKNYEPYICEGQRHEVKMNQGEFFFHIPLRAQLYNHLPNIQSDQWVVSSESNDLISDISNAKLAKNLKMDYNNKLTLTLLSDEVAATKSTGLKILPIFISINEIEPATRRDHFFLVGLFVGNTKPKATVLLKPICEELKELENVPVTWTELHSRVSYSATFHLIGLVADAPMRAYLRCVKQYNANYGCDWCFIYAGSLNGARCYPVIHPAEVIRLKRKKKHFLNFKRYLNSVNINRPLGPKYDSMLAVSPLIDLDSFDIVSGVAVEPMHAIILGTFRNIFSNAWLAVGSIFTQPEEVTWVKQEMSRRLKMIKVPSVFNRVTRGLDEVALWKSSEYDSFMEYYIISVTKDLLPDENINHMLVLSKIYLLSHRGPVSSADKAYLEGLIYEFQLGVEHLYGPSFMTYNLHSLSHLPDSLINLGPNCNLSAYPLEDHMGMLKEKVNRYSGMAQSLLRVFLCRFKYIETLGGTISRWKLNEKEKKDFGMLKLGLVEDIRQSFRKFKGTQSQITSHKRFAKDMILRSYPNNRECFEDEIEIYESLRIGNVKIDHPYYGRSKQTDNCHFKRQNNKYYKVHMIFSASSEFFVVGKEFKEQPFVVKYRNCDRPSVQFELDHVRSVNKLMASFTLIPLLEIKQTVLFIPGSKFTKMKDQIIDPFLVNI